MPWLPMYLDKKDVQAIQTYLNADEEIAFIVSNGPKRWKTVKTVDKFPDGVYRLWFIPSGPLPLVPPTSLNGREPTEDDLIMNPWKGWSTQPSFKYWFPDFGGGHPGVFRLTICSNSKNYPGKIGISGVEWIGDHFKIIGHGADNHSKAYWNKLKNWVKKNAKQIPREGSIEGPKPEIWAFPSALKGIEVGKNRANNPDI